MGRNEFNSGMAWYRFVLDLPVITNLFCSILIFQKQGNVNNERMAMKSMWHKQGNIHDFFMENPSEQDGRQLKYQLSPPCPKWA